MIDLAGLEGGLIVSCQAPVGSPLRRADLIAAIAEAAVQGGAVAIRANSPEHVAAIHSRVDVPIIGLWKRIDANGQQWITPTIDDVAALVEAGSDIVAMDATLRARPDGGSFAELLAATRERFAVAVMADADNAAAGHHAIDLGTDIVGTTLSGYTEPLNIGGEPDIALVGDLASYAPTRVVAEGRIKTPAEVAAAFAAGAFAVVVGTSITEPIALTRRFAAAAPAAKGVLA